MTRRETTTNDDDCETTTNEDDCDDRDDWDDDWGERWDDQLTPAEWEEFEESSGGGTVLPFPGLRAGSTDPTLAEAHLAARENYTIATAVALAVRRVRASRGLNQRLFAGRLGWSKSQLSRLEARPAMARLGDVAHALEGSQFELAIVTRTDDATHLMTATDWQVSELIARDCAGRRFAATSEVRRVGSREWVSAQRWFRYGEDPPPWVSHKNVNAHMRREG